jgi:Fic family protein
MPALRKYEISHPWLSFRLQMERASPALWIALGEAQSKCHHLAGVPLQPKIAEEMHRVYLARGLLATTAIEGNTLTEQQVRDFLDKKLKLPKSQEYLKQEIDNVLDAFNGILAEISARRIVPLTTQLIKTFNSQVLHKLALDAEVLPGQIRRHSVGVGNYLGAPAEDCEYLLQRFCEWMNTGFVASAGNDVIYALVKSIVAHVYVAWIHPFGDGNGRTARLLEVKFLMEAGVPSAAAHLLSNHYNKTRTEYYKQLERASKSNGDLLPFIHYAVTGFVDQLREQIEAVKNQQLMVSWINHVHGKLSQKTPAERRQRDVVLAMSEKYRFIKAGEIRQLTPHLAALYATKTPKTIARDLNRLKRLELVESSPEGWRANIKVMIAFLPTTLNRQSAAVEPPKAKEPQLELGLTFPAG